MAPKRPQRRRGPVAAAETPLGVCQIANGTFSNAMGGLPATAELRSSEFIPGATHGPFGGPPAGAVDGSSEGTAC